MQGILADLEARVFNDGLRTSDHMITSADVTVAIKRLNLHKNDSTNHGHHTGITPTILFTLGLILQFL